VYLSRNLSKIESLGVKKLTASARLAIWL